MTYSDPAPTACQPPDPPPDSPEALSILAGLLEMPGCDAEALLGAWHCLELGLVVIPCRPGEKQPLRSYLEQTRSWRALAAYALREIENRRPQAWGIVPQPGDLFLDRDRPDDPPWLAKLPPTFSVRRGDRLHRYYRIPADTGSRNGARVDDVDVRMCCRNGSVHSLLIAPGTLHKNGRDRYEIVDCAAPIATLDPALIPGEAKPPPAPLPAEAFDREPPPADARLREALEIGGLMGEPFKGDEDNDRQTFELACQLCKLLPWWSEARIAALLSHWYATAPGIDGEPPTTPRDPNAKEPGFIARKVADAWRTTAADRIGNREARGLIPDEAAPAAPASEWICDPGEPCETEWLIESLGVQRNDDRPVMIAGRPGSRKSMAALSLVIGLATERPLWCGAPAARLRVGFVDFEAGQGSTLKRLRRLARGMGVPIAELQATMRSGGLRCMFAPSRNLASADAEEWLTAQCAGLDLVVIDSLRNATPGADENATEIVHLLNKLSRVTARIGCKFLPLHHLNKSDGVSGSEGIKGACSTVIGFMKDNADDPSEPTRVQFLVLHDGTAPKPFTISVKEIEGDRNADGLPLMVATDAASEQAPSERIDALADRIVRGLERAPEQATQTQAELASLAGIALGGRNRAAFTAALGRLEGRAVISREVVGKREIVRLLPPPRVWTAEPGPMIPPQDR